MSGRYLRLRLCSGGGGFEAIPERPLVLDLRRIRSSLEETGVAVTDARVLLVADLGVEVTITRAGRLLFKTADEELATRTFARLGPFLSFDPRARPRSG